MQILKNEIKKIEQKGNSYRVTVAAEYPVEIDEFDGYETYHHPEGVVFFFNQEEAVLKFSSVGLSEERVPERVEKFVEEMNKVIANDSYLQLQIKGVI